MAAITQERPPGVHSGRRYGSFAGKTDDPGSSHPVGVLTQQRPPGIHSGRRYGSFAGKGGAGPAFGTITPAATSITFVHTGGGTHYRIYETGGAAGSLVALGASPVTASGLTENTEYTIDLSSDGSTVAATVDTGTTNPGGGGGGVAVDLVIQDATHAHTAESLVLTTSTTLAIADATHAHTADNLDLTLGGTTLVIADALHAHTADSLTLTLGYVDLVIQDARHAHTADNLTITGDVDPPAPAPAPNPGGGGGGYGGNTSTPLKTRLRREREQHEAELAEVAELLMALAAAGVLD